MTPALVNEIFEPLICHVEPSEIATELGKIGKQAKKTVFRSSLQCRSFRVAVLELNPDDPASKELTKVDLRDIRESLMESILSTEGIIVEVCLLSVQTCAVIHYSNAFHYL